MVRALVAARYATAKLERLEPLNARLDLLRLQIRLLHNFQLIDDRRYEHVARLVEEVGRQLRALMAKRRTPLRDLYPRITAFPTLFAPFRKASRGKRYRPDVLTFGANLERELFQLQHELGRFTYAPGSYRQFMVREPKPRLVSAAPLRDRVVHHALIAVLVPPLERHFIPTSYANRKGYGTHRALRRSGDHRPCW